MSEYKPSLFNTFHTRIMLLVLLIGIVPLSLLGSYNLIQDRLAFREQAGNDLKARSHAFSNELNNFVSELQRDARGIALLPQIQQVDVDTGQPLLERLIGSEYDDYGKLVVINLKGDMLFNAPASELLSVAHIDSFLKAAQGEQAWVVAPGLRTEDLVLHMHSPIVNDDGSVKAVLGSPVTLPTLAAVVRNDAGDGQDGVAYVLDADGVILLSPTSAEISNKSRYVDLIKNNQPVLNNFYQSYTLDGVDYIAGFATISDLGWTVVVERTTESVLAAPNALLTTSIVGLIAALGLGMVFAFLASRFLTRPLRRLVPAAKAVGAGQSDVPLIQYGNPHSEIGILVTAFDNMRNAVNERETKLRQSEEALRHERSLLTENVKKRTAELEAANRELGNAMRLKDEFMATMSHELRTPLNIVLGLSEALIHGVYNPLQPKQLPVLVNIQSSGQRLLDMVDSVINIAKLQAGQLELQWSAVEVAALSQFILDEARPNCESKGLNLHYETDDIATAFEADALRIKQILCFLMANAVKFTESGGDVGLKIAADEQQRMLKFTVWDTGIGIDEADFQRIFEPFEQGDSGLARSHEGTGLGLAVAKQLAMLHGGDILLSSTLGHGSQFTLILPWRMQQMGSRNVNGTSGDMMQQRPTILLAEDNELGIQTFTDYLTHFGYEVISARNGIEAIEAVDDSIPDIILMDVQMPKMDGLECMRRLRAREDSAEIPIIALTGMAMVKDEARCLEAGANEYLRKPVTLKILRERIEAHLTM